MNARGSTLIALACALVLTVGGGVAQAATSFGKVGEFGMAGSGNGELGTSSPKGVAVDANGNVWVTDGGNARVEKFGSSGEFMSTFGWGVLNGAEEPQVCESPSLCQQGLSGSGGGQFGSGGGFFGLVPSTGVAVAPITGDAYVVDTANGRLERFSASGIYLSELNGKATPAGSFSFPTGVAVSPTTGDVYVADSEHDVVDRFSGAGVYECQITGHATPLQCGLEASKTPQEELIIRRAPRSSDLAIDSNGNLYIADGGHGVVDEFNAAGAYLKQFSVGTESPSAVAVDSSGVVFVAESTKIVEFEPAGTKIAEFGSPELGQAVGVATAGSGSGERVYVADDGNQRVWIFGPVVTPTCATGNPAGSLTATSATVPGTINPEGIKTSYRFQYGTGEAYGSNTMEVSSWDGDEGTEPKEVIESVTGLQPHQTYDYQLVATNAHGATQCGSQTLKTASAKPSIDGQSISGVFTQTGATLQARINPNNEETRWHFEYGRDPSLVGASSTPTQEIAAGFGDVATSEGLNSLQANTTYYYRVLASNAGGGTADGPIESFLTRPATPVTGPASSIAQTEATLTGTLNPGGVDTHYRLEYGPAPCAPTSCGLATSETDAGSGTGVIQPVVGLSGLQPLTVYHYRLVVVNAAGPTYGQEREFTTLPVAPGVTTDPPVTVSASSATLAGEVVPQGAPTTYRIEYGTSLAHGLSAPAPEGDVGSSAEGRHVVVGIVGLQPDTVYHYRLVATNGGGTTPALDKTFRTNAVGTPSGTLPYGFSLTAPMSVGPSTTFFPNLTGLGPIGPSKAAKPAMVLTTAQKLKKALKACKAKPRKRRPPCESQTRRPTARRRRRGR